MPRDITGAVETLAAIKEFNNDLYKEMNSRIKAAMLPVRDKARGYVKSESQLLSGWSKQFGSEETMNYSGFPKFYYGLVVAGISYREGATAKPNKKGWKVSHYIINRDPAGAIYETAGRRSGDDGRPTSYRLTSHHKLKKDQYSWTVRNNKYTNNSLNPNAGKQFIASLGDLYGRTSPEIYAGASVRNRGRLIYRAWEEDNANAAGAVYKAIDTSVDKYNSLNNRAPIRLAA
jgi:hypothetical protein